MKWMGMNVCRATVLLGTLLLVGCASPRFEASEHNGITATGTCDGRYGRIYVTNTGKDPIRTNYFSDHFWAITYDGARYDGEVRFTPYYPTVINPGYVQSYSIKFGAPYDSVSKMEMRLGYGDVITLYRTTPKSGK